MNQRERYKTPWAPFSGSAAGGLGDTCAPAPPPSLPSSDPSPPALVPSVSQFLPAPSCPSALTDPGIPHQHLCRVTCRGFESESLGPGPRQGTQHPGAHFLKDVCMVA